MEKLVDYIVAMMDKQMGNLRDRFVRLRGAILYATTNSKDGALIHAYASGVISPEIERGNLEIFSELKRARRIYLDSFKTFRGREKAERYLLKAEKLGKKKRGEMVSKEEMEMLEMITYGGAREKTQREAERKFVDGFLAEIKMLMQSGKENQIVFE